MNGNQLLFVVSHFLSNTNPNIFTPFSVICDLIFFLLRQVPNDIPASYACSMSTDSATAYRLLRDFGVKKGDWIIQSDAASPVGLAVIQVSDR